MSVVAIITARGGSKRIPRKNIKDFMGKPMIAYAIQACIESSIFDEVMVSTEDLEIANIAKQYGAYVPFIRSNEKANDYTTTYDVLEEVINNYKASGKEFDNLCCVYPCVPFLTGKTLKEAYEKFSNTKCDTLIPVVKFSFPIQRAFRIDDKNHLQYREPENALKRSQDLESMYHDVGMFYFAQTNNMLENKALVGKSAAYIEMNESQIQDIDTTSDWEMAELKYKITAKGEVNV